MTIAPHRPPESRVFLLSTPTFFTHWVCTELSSDTVRAKAFKECSLWVQSVGEATNFFEAYAKCGGLALLLSAQRQPKAGGGTRDAECFANAWSVGDNRDILAALLPTGCSAHTRRFVQLHINVLRYLILHECHSLNV